MADRDVSVRIKGSQDVDKAAKQSENALGALAGKVGDLARGIGAFVGAAALGKFFKDSVQEAANAERGLVRLGTAVDNAGGNFAALKPELEAAVARVQRLSTASGGDLRAALTNLITVTGDTRGSLQNLGLVTDLAAFKNISLEQAATTVGKAMAGNTKELKALGIETKDGAAAIDDLRAKIGGLAEREANTFSGSLTRINNQWGDFKEAVGNAILGAEGVGGAANALVTVLGNLAAWVERNEDGFRSVVEAIGSVIGAIVDIGKAIWDVVQPALSFLTGGHGFGLLAAIIGEVSVGIKGFAGVFLLALGTIEEALGGFVEKAGKVLGLFGIKVVEGYGKTLKETGQRAVDQGWILLNKAAEQHEAVQKKLTESTKKGGKARVEEEKASQEGQTGHAIEHGAKRTEAQEKELEKQRKAREKADAELLKSLKDTAKALEEGIKKQAKETGEAADAAKVQLLGMLGPTMKGTIQSTGQAIDMLLAALKGKLPKEDYQQLAHTAGQWKTTLVEMLSPADSFAESVKKTLGDYKETAKAAKEIEKAQDKHLEQIIGVARGALDMAQAFGLADSEAASLLNSVINIGDGLKKALGGDLTGIIQIIGGLANVITSWGNSAAEKERKRILELNTKALHDNTDALTIGATGKTQGGVQAALDAVLSGNFEEAAKRGPHEAARQIGQARQKFFDQLASAGVSKSQAEELIDQLGFSEGFKSGDAQTFFATLKALQAKLKNLGPQTGRDFDSQLDFLEQELEFDATGDEDADKQKRLEALVGFASGFSPAIRRALRGGVANKAAQQAAATNLRSLYALLRPGGPGIDPSDLGNISLNQFKKLLELLIPLLGGTPPIGGETAGASSAGADLGLDGTRGVGIGGEPGKGGLDVGLPPIADTGLLGIGGGSRGVSLPALDTPKFPALLPAVEPGVSIGVGRPSPSDVALLEPGDVHIDTLNLQFGPVEMRDDGLPPEQVAEKLATHVARVLGHRYTLQRSSLGQAIP